MNGKLQITSEKPGEAKPGDAKPAQQRAAADVLAPKKKTL
jgi:hypothetical protein